MCRHAVYELSKLFDVFWEWADPSFPIQKGVSAYSRTFQATLTVAPWEYLVPEADRDHSPFDTPKLASWFDISHPFQLPKGASGFISSSPYGSLTGVRVPDIDALVHTLQEAKTSASLSVMDFLPASDFEGGHGGAPVFWPTLTNAILGAVYSKPIHLKLLVSHWAHTGKEQVDAMYHLTGGLAACKNAWQKCAGSLEIKQYFVPGWNATLPSKGVKRNANATWPSYTRVNHAKYIVTDNRVNVGTSNWQWGYFHNTAGASLNVNDTGLIEAAQAAFDADWESEYAVAM